MNNQAISAVIISAIGAGIISVLSGCGITYGDLTIGTTGYLEQVNKGKGRSAVVNKSELRAVDRRQLEALIASKTNTPMRGE